MNTHVFVVDSTTFKYHLEYKFAGTGAGDKQAPFLLNSNISFPATTERMLVGMVADISRIRIGDNVVFYLQSHNGAPGMFYGIFKVESEPFFDENNDSNYLKDELGKGLSFRILISGGQVYRKGVTEHEFLDSLKGKNHPSDLCWSLIYRKLKGNRGCTMIMDYEYEDLKRKLDEKNEGSILDSANFTFNSTSKEIESDNLVHIYEGVQNEINILNRLIYKYNRNNAFETHLQAYLTKHLDKAHYRNLLLPLPDNCTWIGNEVSCGVGMQRIDLMIKQETDNDVFIKVIELKQVAPYQYIVDKQLPWYLEWLSDYVIPKYRNKHIHVIPSVIARGGIDGELKNLYENFNFHIEVVEVSNLEYIGFNVNNNEIELTKYL